MMMRTLHRRTARSMAVTLLTLALAACRSSGSDNHDLGVVDVGNDDGLGSVLDGASSTDDTTGGAAINPFQTSGDDARPTQPLDDPGDPGDPPDDGPTTPSGVGPTVPDFGGVSGTPDDGTDPTSPSANEAVLDRLQNEFVSEDEFDLWACSAPQATELSAVGYLFVDNAGVLVLVPTEGDAQAAEYTASEGSAGAITNVYTDLGVTETMGDFRFADADAFTATSDLVGSIDCARFLVDENAGSNGTPASVQLENGIDSEGDVSDA